MKTLTSKLVRITSDNENYTDFLDKDLIKDFKTSKKL